MSFSGSLKTFIILALLCLYSMADEKDDYEDNNYNYPVYDQDDGLEMDDDFYHKTHKAQAWDETDYDSDDDTFENLQQPEAKKDKDHGLHGKELLDSPDIQLIQSYLTRNRENGSLRQEEQQLKFLQNKEDNEDTTTDSVLENQHSLIEEEEHNEEEDASTAATFEKHESEEQEFDDVKDVEWSTMVTQFFSDYKTPHGKEPIHDHESFELEDLNFEAEEKKMVKMNEKGHIKSEEELEGEQETPREYHGHQLKKPEYNNSVDADRPTTTSYPDYLRPPVKREKSLLAIEPIQQSFLKVQQQRQPQATSEDKDGSNQTNDALQNLQIDREEALRTEQQDKFNLEFDIPEYSDYEEVEEPRTEAASQLEEHAYSYQPQVKERKDYDFDSKEAVVPNLNKQLMHLIWGPSFIMLPNGRDYVQGKQYQTALTGRYYQAFLGLQYGTIDEDIEYFQPIVNISKIKVAISEPTGCPSLANLLKINDRRFNVNDCLTLSVFTPNVLRSLPVLIYIHGEMLFDGSSEKAAPEHLLENDVVLVVVKYRLASFGFYEVSENLALSDLELATIWVIDNIASFGGDPKSISLFGGPGSAGLVYALDRSLRVETKFLEVLNNT